MATTNSYLTTNQGFCKRFKAMSWPSLIRKGPRGRQWTGRPRARVSIITIWKKHTKSYILTRPKYFQKIIHFGFNPSLNTQFCIKGLLVVRIFCFWAICAAGPVHTVCIWIWMSRDQAQLLMVILVHTWLWEVDIIDYFYFLWAEMEIIPFIHYYSLG